jgi:hypothetical protein
LSQPFFTHAHTKAEGDELKTDEVALEAALEKHGSNVFCCVTTASCFAPRVPDNFEVVARLCSKYDVGHVVNNAYGLQCAATMKLLSRAMRVGRVDAIVQSTDKNFMVNNGGKRKHWILSFMFREIFVKPRAITYNHHMKKHHSYIGLKGTCGRSGGCRTKQSHH